jgi:hypothetical protein
MESDTKTNSQFSGGIQNTRFVRLLCGIPSIAVFTKVSCCQWPLVNAKGQRSHEWYQIHF